MENHDRDGQVAQGGTGSPLTEHKLWTFLIRGGEPLELLMSRTPRLEHNGGTTIWKMVGTVRIAESIKLLVEEAGASVDLHTEVQTEEQTAERRRLLGIED